MRAGGGLRVCGLRTTTAHEAGLARLACTCGCAACAPPLHTRRCCQACGRGETCVLLCQRGRRVCGLRATAQEAGLSRLACACVGVCGRRVCGLAGVRFAHCQYARGGAGRLACTCVGVCGRRVCGLAGVRATTAQEAGLAGACGRRVCGCAVCVPIRKRRCCQACVRAGGDLRTALSTGQAGVRFACQCARGGAGRRVCGLRATAHEEGLSRLACACAGGLRAKGVRVCGLRANTQEEVLSGVCAGGGRLAYCSVNGAGGCAVCVPMRKRRGWQAGVRFACHCTRGGAEQAGVCMRGRLAGEGCAGVRLAHHHCTRGGAGRRMRAGGLRVCGLRVCVPPLRKRRGWQAHAGGGLAHCHCTRGGVVRRVCGRRVCGLRANAQEAGLAGGCACHCARGGAEQAGVCMREGLRVCGLRATAQEAGLAGWRAHAWGFACHCTRGGAGRRMRAGGLRVCGLRATAHEAGLAGACGRGVCVPPIRKRRGWQAHAGGGRLAHHCCARGGVVRPMCACAGGLRVCGLRTATAHEEVLSGVCAGGGRFAHHHHQQGRPLCTCVGVCGCAVCVPPLHTRRG